MKTDLVTIVIPVYNVEKYLDTCVKSVINQTYKNLEVILVNDGSTDSSLDICKHYSYDNRILIIDKKNEGLSSARQIGIDKAHGKYICMVDSDDYIEKDFVEKMHSKISSDGSDTCVCATRYYAENYNRIYMVSDQVKSKSKITVQDIETKYFTLLGNYAMSDSWNKIYEINFIRNSGVRFSLEREYNGTDLLFNHRLLLYLPQISVLNEPVYNHQILENSRVRRKNKQLQKGFMIIMSQIISEVEKLNYSNVIYKQLNCLYVKFLREASQDIFNYGLNSKEIKDKFYEFHEENKRYLSEHRLLDLDVKQMNTFSLKVFCLCIKSQSSMKLFHYLSLRQKIMLLLNNIYNTKER